MIEFIASVLVLVQMWLYGRKSLYGPWVGMLANALWIIIATGQDMYSLLVLNVILACINAWNYMQWSAKDGPIEHLERVYGINNPAVARNDETVIIDMECRDGSTFSVSGMKRHRRSF